MCPMKFILLRKKVNSEDEFVFWATAVGATQLEAIKKVCRENNLPVPGFIKKETRPKRTYYLSGEYIICVRRFNNSDSIYEIGDR